MVNLIQTTDRRDWRDARKTKPIKAKPLSQIVSDPNLFAHLLLKTIEGVQPLRPASMVCLGIAGEAWPQTKDKLLKTYTITDIDPESGWLTCTPKPDNSVEIIQITSGNFSIKGLWGEVQSDGSFLQHGAAGDYIARSKAEPRDVWIVARAIFESTYEV